MPCPYVPLRTSTHPSIYSYMYIGILMNSTPKPISQAESEPRGIAIKHENQIQKKSPPPPRGTESAGNVFADLGLPHPEQELLKAQLTLQIHSLLKDSGMTQTAIAKILGVRQPQISLLPHGPLQLPRQYPLDRHRFHLFSNALFIEKTVEAPPAAVSCLVIFSCFHRGARRLGILLVPRS